MNCADSEADVEQILSELRSETLLRFQHFRILISLVVIHKNIKLYFQ
jgi:hypothetical protein